MASAVQRRMLKEYLAIQKNSATRPHLESLDPIQENDLLHWQAVLLGTADSAYEGGRFKLDIVIPPNYPIQPPSIHFLTKICHPNVHFKTGEICLDILKSEWTPAWTLESVCVAISSLLTNPEPSSPLNCDAANLLRCGDLAGYNSLVRMYTALYAMGDEEEA
ncbi:ubiquitin-conjugating enzyme/RWD-like protein [Mortierella sp. GBAus27b]|nr:ubiquitin-conjugating enzyme/RWD-like protein [Mortierella sp. GBAus27b]